MKNTYSVSLINNEGCNFDNAEFTNLKNARSWASGRGGKYTACFRKNYNADLNYSEKDFEVNYK